MTPPRTPAHPGPCHRAPTDGWESFRAPRPAPRHPGRTRRALGAAPTLCAGAIALTAVALLAGCVRTVLSGDDPDVRRPTATGDNARDVLVIEIPWMEAPNPRLLMNGQPIEAERVSARNSHQQASYFLRTKAGATAEVDVTTAYPGEGIVDFTYTIKRLPPGYGLDVPIALVQVGRRGAISVAVNGAPYAVAPSTDVAIVTLARDEKTRIRCTLLPAPPAAAPGSGAAPAPATGQPGGAAPPTPNRS